MVTASPAAATPCPPGESVPHLTSSLCTSAPHTPCFLCLQEFKASDDVSLIIHTVTYPELLYRQDMILLELQSYLTSLNITNTLFMGDSKLPHIHVTGALLAA
jgi:hypothetical protein